MKYFKDNPNDQWIRSVDFTPSYCIGQSSAICSELPCGCQLPDFIKCVASYKVRIGNFILQTSSALSCYHDLVPIVDSPPSVDLPYSILFKINILVQHGRFSWPTLDEDFYMLVDSSQTNSHLIEYALNQLFHLKEICYEPSKLLKKYTTSETDKPPPRESLDSGFVYVHKVMITPCKVYFCGPELIMSNRVLRNYREDIDNFLRVSFVDEDLNKLHLADVPTPGRCTSSAFQIRYGGYKGEITNILKELLSCGYEPSVEPFVAMMLRTFKEVQLMELRTKTRILIPDGRSLMGCLDQTGTLEYGQVFLQCFGTRHSQFFYDSVTLSGKRFIVEEQVVVGKSPCLHPGDVRVLMAVDVLALHHMVDCVVFPQKEPRPHPDAGSSRILMPEVDQDCATIAKYMLINSQSHATTYDRLVAYSF
ncbi:hypothetical protein ACFXTO_048026 [Malus domestica]